MPTVSTTRTDEYLSGRTQVRTRDMAQHLGISWGAADSRLRCASKRGVVRRAAPGLFEVTRVVNNGRGLGEYIDLRDGRGTQVRVKDSSSAEAPHIWVFVKETPGTYSDTPGEASLHITLEEASRLRDALDTAIRFGARR